MMDSKIHVKVFCSSVADSSVNIVTVLLLITHLVMSEANWEGYLGENNMKENGFPCYAESSLMYNGSCVLCVHPNQSLLSYWKEGSSEISSNVQISMCSSLQQDSEQLQIDNAKAFLNGRTLRVVTIERLPFVKVSSNKFTGIVFELMYALQEEYNFTYAEFTDQKHYLNMTMNGNRSNRAGYVSQLFFIHRSDIFLPYDGNWGAEGENGTWNGMIGQVLKNEADIGAAGFSVTLERAKVVDFSMPFHQEPAGILIPAPRPGNKLAILVRPLSSEVWLAVFTTICVLVPSLFVMHTISLRIRQDVDIHKPVNASQLIGDLLQFIVGSLVQESIVSPVNKTSRFLIVIWWFLTLVLSNVYMGYMVSFLSAPKLFDIVDDLEGLVHQTSIKWTYRRHTALEDLFQSDASGIYRAIGTRASDNDLVNSDMAGMEKVFTGKFAFLKERSFLDVAIGTDFAKAKKCRITVAKGTFFNAAFAIIVQRGSEILNLLDSVILNVVNTGLMEKWKSMHWPRNLWCVNAATYMVSTQPKSRKLTMDDCQGEYLILLCGLTAATVSFLFEMRSKWRLAHNGWQRKFFKKRVTSPSLTTTTTTSVQLLNGVQIIMIPVKEGYYHKLRLSEERS